MSQLNSPVDKEKIHTLYLKTHNKTGKHYLGYHGPTNRQIVQKYKGSGIYWLNHIKKYGDDIKTIILCQAQDKDVDLFNERCMWYSKWYDVVNNDNFANLCHETGTLGTTLGYKRTQEAIDKSRESNKGFKHTQESIAKMRENKKGFKHTQETIDKMREDKKGYKHTQEAKDKMSTSRKGKKHTQEHKDNRSKAMKEKNPNSMRQIWERSCEAGEYAYGYTTFHNTYHNPKHKNHQLVLNLIKKYTI